MIRRKRAYLAVAAVVTIIIAATSFIGNRRIPKPAEIPASKVRLNLTVTNSDSEIPELEGLDKKVRYYMRKWQFKGASLAVTRNDSLVYAKGYGWADEEKEIEMGPGNTLELPFPHVVSHLLVKAFSNRWLQQ